MKNNQEKMHSCCENYYDNLICLESIIKMTKNVCQEHEFSANYYELPSKYKYFLSEERNNYINMLAIALDKVDKLKLINEVMEETLYNLQKDAYYCS